MNDILKSFEKTISQLERASGYGVVIVQVEGRLYVEVNGWVWLWDDPEWRRLDSWGQVGKGAINE